MTAIASGIASDPGRALLGQGRPLPDDMIVRWTGITTNGFDRKLFTEMLNDKPHAEIQVDGRTVATVSSNGYLTTTKAIALRLQDLIAKADPDRRGTALADERADQIARALGGEVVRATSALVQMQAITPVATPATLRIEDTVRTEGPMPAGRLSPGMLDALFGLEGAA